MLSLSKHQNYSRKFAALSLTKRIEAYCDKIRHAEPDEAQSRKYVTRSVMLSLSKHQNYSRKFAALSLTKRRHFWI